MKILLTNDDSFDAEGLQGLYAAISKEHDCFIVAPDAGRSCCGHAVTNGLPLEVHQRSEQGWAVSGTPADCVRVALLWLGLKPDLVVSGLNHGGNLGVDILYSGTVAAAREACLMGVPSIAISQYMRRDIVRDWTLNGVRARSVLDQVLSWPQADGGFWNVNLPALPIDTKFEEVQVHRCPAERQPLNFDYSSDSNLNVILETNGKKSILYQSNYQTRPRTNGSDVELCFSGIATATWLDGLVFNQVTNQAV